MTPSHPAKYTDTILTELAGILADEQARRGPIRVLDPMAGIGRIHTLASLGIITVGVELEPEWAEQHPDTLVGDALNLRFADATFSAIVVSPAYGNRLADSYAGDPKGSRRLTYRISLGRPLSPSNGGQLQWGSAYRAMHTAAWREADRVLRPNGLMVLNVSNHIRDGAEQLVAEFHLRTLLDLGHRLVEVRRVATPRHRHGQNHEARVDGELIIVTRKAP